jgi:hypothetical protein
MTNFRRYDVRIEAGRTDFAFATFLIKRRARACFAPIKNAYKMLNTVAAKPPSQSYSS